MNLVEIAKSYAAGKLSAQDAENMVKELDFPVYNTDWDGKYLVSGNRDNSAVKLSELLVDNTLTDAQYNELVSMLPKKTDADNTHYAKSWKDA